MFMLFIFEISKGILKKLEFYHQDYFATATMITKKYRLVTLAKDQHVRGITHLSLIENKS